ncbi:hypothetical protein R5W24_001712 [Gemmata sp. JC717]|uniref:hypothetical protein n=1 Tax=Gemmata algarum TaxID=2975278 RepID=UPI0021BA70A3|nr:hypothetical protein [Gemmata algarum]MDY3552626.1 hypothetical protein [Gemmata algarum]
MGRARFWFAAVVLGLACAFVPVAQSQPAQPAQPAQIKKAAPKLEPVADTKLLMEGLADPNARALGKLFAAKPKDAEAWAFARGQSLLLAELGNLLLMRPPRTKEGQEPWLAHAADLRERAGALARASAAKEYLPARAALAGVANACNRCHQSFRVGVRVDPFPEDR